PVGDVFALGRVAQRGGPVGFQGDLFQLIGAVTGGVEATDDRPHAGAGYRMNWDIQLLDLLEHTDVGQAAGTAAGQYQAGTDAVGGRGGLSQVQRRQQHQQ